MEQKVTFEESLDFIEKEIEKRRGKWNLSTIKHLDFDDVKQNIIIHIFQKWDKYNPEYPLENWLNRIITNQIFNHKRDHYGIYSKPCDNCAFAVHSKETGEDGCRYTKSKKQCSECPLYAKWEKGKKSAFEMNRAKNIEYHYSDITTANNDNIDYGKFLRKIDKILKKRLQPVTYKVYKMIYIQGLSKTEVAKNIGYSSSDSDEDQRESKTSGYKQILAHQKKIKDIVKLILGEEDYDFIE